MGGMSKAGLPWGEFYVPDGAGNETALQRTRFLGVGAHADDLEFMALHGILAGRAAGEPAFGGVVCTDGAGSARAGRWADLSVEELRATRRQEQREAARIGGYSFIAQWPFASADLRTEAGRGELAVALQRFVSEAAPEVIYTHNPFDKHPTHRAVLSALLDALAGLPAERRPRQLLGCEVWRGLDWLPEPFKVALDVSDGVDLSARLAGCFASQIEAGKRYDLAVAGRRRANATFLDAHSVDAASAVDYAVDLTALMGQGSGKLATFADAVLAAYAAEIRAGLD